MAELHETDWRWDRKVVETDEGICPLARMGSLGDFFDSPAFCRQQRAVPAGEMCLLLSRALARPEALTLMGETVTRCNPSAPFLASRVREVLAHGMLPLRLGHIPPLVANFPDILIIK